jgi:hypothetical protein
MQLLVLSWCDCIGVSVTDCQKMTLCGRGRPLPQMVDRRFYNRRECRKRDQLTTILRCSRSLPNHEFRRPSDELDRCPSRTAQHPN